MRDEPCSSSSIIQAPVWITSKMELHTQNQTRNEPRKGPYLQYGPSQFDATCPVAQAQMSAALGTKVRAVWKLTTPSRI